MNGDEHGLPLLRQVEGPPAPTARLPFSSWHSTFSTISDGRHLQTGSFNYSRAAASSNSENVLVLWNAKSVAQDYTAHFNSRWQQGEPFRGRSE